MLYNKKNYIFGLWFIFLVNLSIIYFVFDLSYKLYTILIIQLIIILIIIINRNKIEKKRTINFIELIQSDIDNFQSCAICLDEDITSIVKLKCGHLYHKKCIYPWLENHNNCPTCRELVINC